MSAAARVASTNIAEDVLTHAPAGWNPSVEGVLRKRLWSALKTDDAGQMAKALRMYTTEPTHPTGGWPIEKLLIRLRLALWKGSAGKGRSGKRRGLLHACSANEAGVPSMGAVRCLRKLLEIAPPDEAEIWQIRTAIADCERLGRRECIEILTGVLSELERQL
eukprot:5704452-Prymnesium_polylepis.4